jgi:hypothetical protein
MAFHASSILKRHTASGANRRFDEFDLGDAVVTEVFRLHITADKTFWRVNKVQQTHPEVVYKPTDG